MPMTLWQSLLLVLSSSVGSDYTILDNSVTIPASDTQACFSVQIIDDPMDELDEERFTVEVTSMEMPGVSLGSPSTFDVRISG